MKEYAGLAGYFSSGVSIVAALFAGYGLLAMAIFGITLLAIALLI